MVKPEANILKTATATNVFLLPNLFDSNPAAKQLKNAPSGIREEAIATNKFLSSPQSSVLDILF